MRNILFAAALALSGLNAHAQFSEFRPGVVADGVNYALPRTGVDVDIEAQKIEYVPGEFARYAERYLHIQNVRPTEDTHWIISDMQFSQFGEPDSLKFFTVKMKDKSIAPMAQLTKGGVLVAINKEVELDEEKEYPHKKRTNHRLDSKRYMTSEILAATSTAKMAELTAQEIFDIRDSKNSIRRGQVESMPKDGPSLKIVLDQLDEQEEALMQLFIGYTDTTTIYETFSVVPEADIEKEVLFRFSKKLGLVDYDDVAGEPYYISVKNQHTVPTPTEAEAKKRKVQGLVYNIPGIASVKIFNTTTTFYDKKLEFGQFGTTDALAPVLFGKESTVNVVFSPISGRIVKVDK